VKTSSPGTLAVPPELFGLAILFARGVAIRRIKIVLVLVLVLVLESGPSGVME
jgi:hypothetical protein